VNFSEKAGSNGVKVSTPESVSVATKETSLCRVCRHRCPIVVTLEDGRVTDVAGDRENETWKGHTCVKGRNQHVRLHAPTASCTRDDGRRRVPSSRSRPRRRWTSSPAGCARSSTGTGPGPWPTTQVAA
jgi:anaerobic selenocysteine-containing dehydrogenase